MNEIAFITGVIDQNGTPRKLMDNSKLQRLGSSSTIDLKTEIIKVYKSNINGVR